MLTRKQQWRRVRCRTNKKARTNVSAALVTLGMASVESPASTSSSITAWSSFDSSVSDSADCIGREDVNTPPPSSAPNVRAKGVTFEPMVQVYLVTHKSEIDNRSKQALWWTRREAAMNKRAWLQHLEQPGCGRQSAGRVRQSWKARSLRSIGFAGGLSTYHDERDLAFRESDGSESVGILGCRCHACLTEGDEYDNSPQLQAPRPPQHHRKHQTRRPSSRRPGLSKHESHGDEYYPEPSTKPARVGRRSRGIGNTEGWAVPQEWRRSSEAKEKGCRSFSPDIWRENSPLEDAVARDSSAGAYFWDRE